MEKASTPRIKRFIAIALLMIGMGLSSCSGEIYANPNPDPVEVPGIGEERVTEVAMIDPIPSSTLPSNHIPISTPTLTNTPTPTKVYHQGDKRPTAPAPPRGFIPKTMKPGVSPTAYITNTCTYLENRWGEGKSNPGTIVVPIMFHSVVQPGRAITDSTSISMEYFEYFMQTAKEMGFSTITADELVGFLEHNQAIPERSMILILDDRRPGVTELFMPYLEENDWTLTLGWITTDTTRDSDWEKMTNLAETGRLDVQSHGHNHIYIQNYVAEEQIAEELFKPIEVIEARFGTTPVAHIWPGGNFNEQSIAMAGEAGYKIGFTVFSRGPIMFNWVPLGEPEMAMNAPLMLLPRFWSTGAVQALEEAVLVSESVQKHASDVVDAELAYYHTYCQPPGSE